MNGEIITLDGGAAWGCGRRKMVETCIITKKDLGFIQGLFYYFTACEPMKREINESVSVY